MLDPTPVHRDMEAIFALLDRAAEARPGPRARGLPPPARRRGFAQLLFSREGLVGAGFASAALLAGVAASIYWTAAHDRAVAPPVATHPIARPAQPTASHPDADELRHLRVDEDRYSASPPLVRMPTPHPRRTAGRRKDAERPGAVTEPSEIAAPHLTGAALQQALVEDAAITRRLNLQQKGPEKPPLSGP